MVGAGRALVGTVPAVRERTSELFSVRPVTIAFGSKIQRFLGIIGGKDYPVAIDEYLQGALVQACSVAVSDAEIDWSSSMGDLELSTSEVMVPSTSVSADDWAGDRMPGGYVQGVVHHHLRRLVIAFRFRSTACQKQAGQEKWNSFFHGKRTPFARDTQYAR